jgi:hypothetical protein
LWRGRPGLASRWHLAGGREQGQDALATPKIANRKSQIKALFHIYLLAQSSGLCALNFFDEI